MPEPSLQNLSADALAVLRRHNLLKAVIRADITATAVKSIALPQDECEQLWSAYLSQQFWVHQQSLILVCFFFSLNSSSEYISTNSII